MYLILHAIRSMDVLRLDGDTFIWGKIEKEKSIETTWTAVYQ